MVASFDKINWHLPSRSGTQQIGLFVNTVSGDGITIPFTTNIGDVNPLLPLSSGAQSSDWVEFTVPSNILSEFGDDVCALSFQGLGIITNNNMASKWSGFYLAGRAADFPNDGVSEWDGWAPQVQMICAPLSGERVPISFIVPVEKGKYDLKWYYVQPDWATVTENSHFALNLSIAGFAVKSV